MKSFFAVFTAVATVSASAVYVLQARDTCGSTIVPIYRLYNGDVFDHYYTTTPAQVISAVSNSGYVLEGVSAAVFPTQQGTTLPLYGLYNSASHDHFLTTDPVERDLFRTNKGYVLEGTVALVYTTQICGSVPLYRLFAVSQVDHFYTTSAEERAAALALGFVDEGIVAYVPAKGIVTGESV
ncbi:hypothetical protein FB451DRAFT_161495 [Mycena latifolia]|nr:hypothetical protein FB451DRAFT_161495 [Mycena latifolia]